MNSTQIVKKFLDAENKRDWNKWASFLGPNVTFEIVGSGVVTKGKKEYIKRMKNTYSELEDWQFKIINIMANDDIVFVEFGGSGHFTGREGRKHYKNIPLNLNAVDIFKLKKGLIYEIREYFDYKSYKHQLSW